MMSDNRSDQGLKKFNSRAKLFKGKEQSSHRNPSVENFSISVQDQKCIVSHLVCRVLMGGHDQN